MQWYLLHILTGKYISFRFITLAKHSQSLITLIFQLMGYHVLITAGNYMFKVTNRNTRATCEICWKLRIKTLVSLLLTLEIFHTLSRVSIVNFEHVNANWIWISKVSHSQRTAIVFLRDKTQLMKNSISFDLTKLLV